MQRDLRGQAYITEALFTIILLSGVVIVATGTLIIDEPVLTVEDRERQNQIDSELNKLLINSVEDGTLKASILNWNEDDRRYADTDTLQDSNGYYLALPSDELGTRLKNFEESHQNASVSIEVTPAGSNATAETKALDDVRQSGYPFISTGSAGQTMVVRETYLTLYSHDRLESPPEAHRTSPTSTNVTQESIKLEDSSSFPIGSASTQSSNNGVYNVVRVRLVAWF